MVSPLYVDHCNHSGMKDQFLGHIVEKDSVYDAYAWEDSDGVNICLRFGNNLDEYASIGTIEMLRKYYGDGKAREDDYHVKVIKLFDASYQTVEGKK